MDKQKLIKEIQEAVEWTTNSEQIGEQIFNQFLKPQLSKIKALEKKVQQYEAVSNKLNFMLNQKLNELNKS